MSRCANDMLYRRSAVCGVGGRTDEWWASQAEERTIHYVMTSHHQKPAHCAWSSGHSAALGLGAARPEQTHGPGQGRQIQSSDLYHDYVHSG